MDKRSLFRAFDIVKNTKKTKNSWKNEIHKALYNQTLPFILSTFKIIKPKVISVDLGLIRGEEVRYTHFWEVLF